MAGGRIACGLPSDRRLERHRGRPQAAESPHSPRAVLAVAFAAVALAVPSATFSQGAGAPTQAAAAKTPPGQLEVLHVQNNVYAIFGAGGNIAVQIGDQGAVLVDAGLPGQSEKIIAAVAKLTPKPIRDVIDTHIHPDHTGGNQVLSTAGGFISGGTTGAGRRDATLYSHENVLLRMSGALGDEKPLETGMWPASTFFNDRKELYINGEAIELIHQPEAHTDGDVMVFFRRSDVIATGDIFDMTSFPTIDRARGGTVNGLIAALNKALDLVIPAPTQERGTMIVPGHGRLADEHDLLEYRDMVVIVRDRIQHMIGKGLTLDQVRASRPTLEYESRWGAETGRWTTAMFVEAVYNSLKEDSKGEGR